MGSVSYKGFDKDLKCRGFQYEVGKEYEEERAVACERGFHACEQPIDVFNYYQPGRGSRYCEVEQSGELSKDGNDSKVASSRIKIGAEIGVPGIVKAQIEYVKAHTTFEHTDPKQATAGENGAATAGYRGAATAGENGAATAGENGAATAGENGAATAGENGAATAGNYGAATSRGASAVGNNGLAVARGNGVKVKGGLGAILVIGEENSHNYDLKEWKAVAVDGETIKADTWYRLKDGKLEEVQDNG